MSHTPGPWEVHSRVWHGKEGGGHAFLEVGSETSAFWVARVQTFDDDKGEYSANARLIAAAPEMLEALRLLVEQLEAYQKIANTRIGLPADLAKAHAAIDKAEGK